MPTRTPAPALSNEAIIESCQKLAAEFFGNREIGAEIEFKLTKAADMHRGAEARRRPATRRDKLVATAKIISKLQASLREFDVQLVADALGRITPTDFSGQSDAEPLLAGLRMARPVPSQAPALLATYGSMLATLEALRGGLENLARVQQGVRRGAAETPDSLMFALEGMLEIWKQHHDPVPAFSMKRGGFGDFASQALGLRPDLYTPAKLRTGLRRLRESVTRKAP